MLCALLLAIVVGACDTVSNRPLIGTSTVESRLESTIGDAKADAAPTAVGSLFGTYHQTTVGKLLDSADRRYAEEVAKKSLEKAPNGTVSKWTNPENRHAGTFTPINSYLSDDRYNCRDYHQSITIDGNTRETDGTACRTGENTWKVVVGPISRERPGRAARRR
jgi:surface antigen